MNDQERSDKINELVRTVQDITLSFMIENGFILEEIKIENEHAGIGGRMSTHISYSEPIVLLEYNQIEHIRDKKEELGITIEFLKSVDRGELLQELLKRTEK